MRIFRDASTRDKWYVDYFFRDKRIRYYAGTSKQAADKLRIRIESEINMGSHDPDRVRSEVRGGSAGMTLGELADLFIKLYRSRGHSGYYGQRVKTYLAHFGRDKPIAEIGPLQVEMFRNALEEQGFGPGTIRKNLVSLGTIFRWAIGKGLVKENPADPVRVKRPSEPPAREIFLSTEQVRQLLVECEPNLRRLVHFLVQTGMRLSEPLKLRWTNVDSKTGWIYVQPGKTGKPRKVPYTELLQAILGSRPRHLKSEFVFCQPSGEPLNPNQMSKRIKAALEAIGMPEASAHSLRHTFISRLAVAGVPTKAIGDLVGQSEVSITSRYIHLTPEAIQQTMRHMHSGETHLDLEAKDETSDAEPEAVSRGA